MGDMVFEHYFSLGVNCEGAYQIRRVLGRDSSCFFSWNVTRFDALLSLLRTRFEGIIERQNLTPRPGTGLIHDGSHDFLFHSPFSAEDIWDTPAFYEKLAIFQDKIRYLIDKFYKIASSGDAVVYFYRTEETENVRERAREVATLLSEFHKFDNFRLVVLQDSKFREPEWGEPLLRNRYMKRFAPWADATDGHVASWDRVFSEFPLANVQLRLANFHIPSAQMDSAAD